MGQPLTSTNRLLGRRVFVRYVDFKTYISTGGRPSKVREGWKTKTIKGIFDNHSEPMFHIDGGDEFGYIIIPRQFIIELYEEMGS